MYQFYSSRYDYIHKRHLSDLDIDLLESLMQEEGSKVVYRSTKTEITERMKQLGALMYKLLQIFKKYPDDDYNTLKCVFYGQFSVNEKKEIIPLEKDRIEAISIQSPHDTDCTYRNKHGNQVKGCAVNVTETCDQKEGKLNLITDVQVDKVTRTDSDFLTPAIDHSRQVLSDDDKTEKVYADGAYHSPENQEFCKKNDIEMVLPAIQGAEYVLTLEQETGNLIVTDKATNQIIPAKEVKSRKDNNTKWGHQNTGKQSPVFYAERP